MSLIDTRALTFLHRMTRSTDPLSAQEVQAARRGLDSLRLQAVWYRRLAWLGAVGSFTLFWLGSNEHGWWLMLVLALLLIPLAWGVKFLERITANGLGPLDPEQVSAWRKQWASDTPPGTHLEAILAQGRDLVVADGFAIQRLAAALRQSTGDAAGSSAT